ncbi:uncharacterized protein A4U43_C03F18420 [Asparagus officinalis]|uniref:Uncharacterized protein n=1 Tax=Asparagus officinalis TaxID=4686 RepID=A0A5P1FBW2_ASPOF|nr:UDP-glycosyltransferase 85A1-like [Asparagus officinalis]ONK75582.1 uncharacterized protein A4U43_C03F18420 [Asparagus officinalis]
MLNFFYREASRASRGTAIVLNTFEELECSVLKEMPSILPLIYTIGPLFLLTNRLPANSLIISLSLSLWKHDTTCIGWLDDKRNGAVVYVNSRGITIMPNEKQVDFSLRMGIGEKWVRNFWVIQPDLVMGENAVMPEEFLVETKGRSLLADWCDQLVVLSYPAIGGFLMHSG